MAKLTDTARGLWARVRGWFGGAPADAAEPAGVVADALVLDAERAAWDAYGGEAPGEWHRTPARFIGGREAVSE